MIIRRRLLLVSVLFLAAASGPCWGKLTESQLKGLQNYWDKNRKVAPECNKLNDDHQGCIIELHMSGNPQANKELAAKCEKLTTELNKCVADAMAKRAREGKVEENVLDGATKATGVCLKGQLTVPTSGGGTDTIYINLPADWPIGQRVDGAPIKTKNGYFNQVYSVLTSSGTTPPVYTLTIYGLDGPEGYIRMDRRLRLTPCK
jgi:hypothetical protein